MSILAMKQKETDWLSMLLFFKVFAVILNFIFQDVLLNLGSKISIYKYYIPGL